MLLRTSLGSNSSKGSIRKHHWGYDLHLPLPSPVSYHRARTTSVFLKFLLVIVLVRRLEILLSRRRGGRRPGWCGQAIPVPFLVACSSIRIEFTTSLRLSKTALFSNRITRIPSSLR